MAHEHRSTAERIAIICQEAKLRSMANGDEEREVQLAFHHLAKSCHPDKGGDPEQFRVLTIARDNLLRRTRHIQEILRSTLPTEPESETPQPRRLN